MANINPSSPGDTDIVSAFPASERSSRAALLELTAGDAFWGGTSAGSANAQTVTVANTGLTLRAGLTVHFIAGFNNTTIDPTLTVNALAPMIVKDKDGNNLGATSAIKLNRQHTVVFDGTNFRLQDPADGQVSYDLRATQNTTSGTEKTFTGIGATAYRITVMFRDLGRNGSDRVHIQLGDSGGYETTGYQGGIGHMDDTDFQVTNQSSVGFPLLDSVSMGSTTTLSGQLILTHMGSNIWTASGGAARTDALDAMVWYGGLKSLSATLTSVRLLAIDTLNSGSVSVSIEYPV